MNILPGQDHVDFLFVDFLFGAKFCRAGVTDLNDIHHIYDLFHSLRVPDHVSLYLSVQLGWVRSCFQSRRSAGEARAIA